MTYSISRSTKNPIPTAADLRIVGLRAGYPTSIFSQDKANLIADGLNFEIPAGSIVALVGANGSGKSTIIRALVDPKFRLGGRVSSDDAPLEPGQIGFVPQQSVLTLFPWRTGLKNAGLWLEIHGQSDAEIKRVVERISSEYEIKVPLHRRITDLSGGERVKIALLRSLCVTDMRVWILDEPFEGLDITSRLLLRDLIRQVAAKGVPILLTSHLRDDLLAVNADEYLVTERPVTTLRPVSKLHLVADRELDSPSQTVTINSPLAEEQSQQIIATKHSKFPLELLGIISGFLLWLAVAYIINLPGLLPSPLSVGQQMLAILSSQELIPHFLGTLWRITGSWLIGICFATPLAIIIGYYTKVYKLLVPWLAVGRAFPVFVLVGVAIGLFPGHAEIQRFFLIALTIFLIHLQIVTAAVYIAPRRRTDLARIYGAGPTFFLPKVMLYESVGGILAGLETSLPLAVILTLVVETFLYPEKGLGFYISNKLVSANLSEVFAAVLWPAILAAIGVWLLRKYAQRWKFDL